MTIASGGCSAGLGRENGAGMWFDQFSIDDVDLSWFNGENNFRWLIYISPTVPDKSLLLVKLTCNKLTPAEITCRA